MGVLSLWVCGCSVIVSLWVFCHCEFMGVLLLRVYGCFVFVSLWVFCYWELHVTCCVQSLWVYGCCIFVNLDMVFCHCKFMGVLSLGGMCHEIFYIFLFVHDLNFTIKYLIKIETEFENTFTCLSGVQMGLNRVKNWGRKSSDTLPLINELIGVMLM